MKRLALILVALIATAVPALFAAGALADYGFLGSCFEGQCAYMAILFAFPLIWVALFSLTVLAWKMRR